MATCMLEPGKPSRMKVDQSIKAEASKRTLRSLDRVQIDPIPVPTRSNRSTSQTKRPEHCDGPGHVRARSCSPSARQKAVERVQKRGACEWASVSTGAPHLLGAVAKPHNRTRAPKSSWVDRNRSNWDAASTAGGAAHRTNRKPAPAPGRSSFPFPQPGRPNGQSGHAPLPAALPIIINQERRRGASGAR